MNLLPTTEKDILKKGAKLRFMVVTLHMTSVAFVIGLIMLLPAYFLARSSISTEELGANGSKAEVTGQAYDILNLPAEIDSKLIIFQSNESSVSVSKSLSQIVSYLPKGVKLDSVSFLRDQHIQDKFGTGIIISGTSVDRDSLLQFGNNLKESALFSSVIVPVGSFTKEINLTFSINIFIEN